MSEPPDAHRTEFTVRCVCGIEYHTSSAHIGRALPCKCGRNITVTAPAEPPALQKRSARKIRRRAKATTGETRRASELNWGRKGSRLSNAWASLVAPVRFGSLPARITAIAAWLYLGAMFAAWMLMIHTSERSLPGTIIAYGPRWLAPWPVALLLPAAILLARAAVWPLLVALLIALVPLMGARASFKTVGAGALPAAPAVGTLRVISFNTLGGDFLERRVSQFLGTHNPDIVMFQECGDQLWRSLQRETERGWYSVRYGLLCTGSRWPIQSMETMPREDIRRNLAQGDGGAGLVMLANINTPDGPVAAVNLHLETARRGLEGLLGSDGLVPDDPFGISNTPQPESTVSFTENERRFTRNAAVRELESERASRWAVPVNKEIALVIAGDFNLPVESTIYRKHWSGFSDAFETVGNGFGWTKREGPWLRIRIDHVLTLRDGRLRPKRIAVGPDYRSDHLPVIVDLDWRQK